MVPMDVLQCPVCALKFRFSSELDQHLSLEHPKFDAKARSGDNEALAEARKKRQLRKNPPE